MIIARLLRDYCVIGIQSHQTDCYANRFELGCDARRDGPIGDDAVYLMSISNMDITALIELRGIENSNHLVRLLDHELIE